MVKKRVCAYCRVSTKKEEQEVSLTSQILYYNELIDSNPEYINAGIFIDHGISGKFQSKRKDFLRMIKECRSGNIDTIYTKTIARFGRNTRETLTTLEELTSLGINVIFEAEGFSTMDNPSETMKAIRSYFAEDEIDKDSNAVKFAWQRRMEAGQFSVNPNTLIGYKYNDKHELVIVPYEAKIVQTIFERYARGDKVIDIINDLNASGSRSSAGCPWSYCNIAYVIKQEKYAGFALMQKYFTENGKRYRNNGDMRQYLIENSNPAIVSRELWEQAQERRKKGIRYDRPRGYVPKFDVFRGIIKCGVCGANMNPIGQRHDATLKYGGRPREHYMCNTRKKGGAHACRNKMVNKLGLEDGFIAIFNELKGKKLVTKQTFQNDEIMAINNKLSDLLAKEKLFLQLKVRELMDDKMQREYDALLDEITQLSNRKKDISKRNIEVLETNDRIDKFNIRLNSMDKMTTFDVATFQDMVESITIMNRNLFIYYLKNGMSAKVRVIDYHLDKDEIEEVEIC